MKMLDHIGSIVTILTAIISVCVFLQNKFLIFSRKYVIWKRLPGKIEARYGDLLKIASLSRLKKKNVKIVVVPVDTEFTMEFVKPGQAGLPIHHRSIHGQWIKKMRTIYGDVTFEELLDYRFQKSLSNGDIQEDKGGRYKIGSILPWWDETDNTIFLLVATGDFDKVTHQPLTTLEDIGECLRSIFKFYRKRKMENVYLPLIGAGMIRVGSPQVIYDKLTKFLEDEDIRKDICSRYTIVVYHKIKKDVRFSKN